MIGLRPARVSRAETRSKIVTTYRWLIDQGIKPETTTDTTPTADQCR
jgi:hypothetical protein